MRGFFHKIFGNLAKIFWGRNLLWHFLAVTLTYIIVNSGFDWRYFLLARNTIFQPILFPAVILGGLVPLTMPFVTLAIGKYRKNLKTINTAYAIGQAALLGFLASDFAAGAIIGSVIGAVVGKSFWSRRPGLRQN